MEAIGEASKTLFLDGLLKPQDLPPIINPFAKAQFACSRSLDKWVAAKPIPDKATRINPGHAAKHWKKNSKNAANKTENVEHKDSIKLTKVDYNLVKTAQIVQRPGGTINKG